MSNDAGEPAHHRHVRDSGRVVDAPDGPARPPLSPEVVGVSRGCSYCGKPGCSYEFCDKRLEERFGSSVEREDDLNDEEKTKPASETGVGP